LVADLLKQARSAKSAKDTKGAKDTKEITREQPAEVDRHR